MQGKTRITNTPDGFDVTIEQTIGRVEFGAGDDDPHTAAFKLIAQNGEPGKYAFPTESGGTCRVEVYYTEPNDSVRESD